MIVSSQPLSFITDDRLTELCSSLMEKAEVAANRAEDEIYANVIDPFSATFDAMRQGISLEEWLEQEKSRQIQKTLQNYVGEFHQAVIGSIEGWEDLVVGQSIDLRNREKNIIAEVKNKHNTMNSSSQLALYDKLQRHLDYDESYKNFTAYCIVIIPKTPRPLNTTFHPSERGTRRPERKSIRLIDGRSFYEIATGEPDGLQKLYYRLPHIIGETINSKPEEIIASSIFQDLFQRAYISR